MNPNERYARTALGVTHALPELVFDLAADRELPRPLGKTETPVNLLPEPTWDPMPGPRGNYLFP
jgi:hypothetical protein